MTYDDEIETRKAAAHEHDVRAAARQVEDGIAAECQIAEQKALAERHARVSGICEYCGRPVAIEDATSFTDRGGQTRMVHHIETVPAMLRFSGLNLRRRIA